ncbi:class I SAM-dependent methyltransferase [Sandaracinobacteroides saxicola]|uniref:Class I SAM-dependent methyltransferase n=1 Tax=Sandaracinobacteroides saxicola TaxID=2759707 RepID=A0A7G5IDS1_9SPHN|nr:class I SAM-dependent methyltransferase [Sandaracinobacteroides saxicola]QMW21513.1 class I SAM-dependent methyltransferase [Sandaracinobacteroides saxicola]
MSLYAETIFPWALDRLLGHPNIQARRAALVAQASGETLEIGFGTGATLPFYRPEQVTRLTVVEPSHGMNRRAAAAIAASPIPVHSQPGAGEHLPFADASFDTVVTCLTLCSVADPRQVLAEIRRVLKPGGMFLFLEHVLSDDPARQRWQQRLNPVQKVIGVGCNLNRNTAAMVRAAGFELPPVDQEVERAFGALAKLTPLVAGVARGA